MIFKVDFLIFLSMINAKCLGKNLIWIYFYMFHPVNQKILYLE